MFNDSHRLWLIPFLALFACPAQAQRFDPAAAAGLRGGLVVQLGAAELDAVADLSHVGRYLIHVLEPDAESVQSAQARLRTTGHYGMAWVEAWDEFDHLPYAENLVNLILIRDFTVPAEELVRVLGQGRRDVRALGHPAQTLLCETATRWYSRERSRKVRKER